MSYDNNKFYALSNRNDTHFELFVFDRSGALLSSNLVACSASLCYKVRIREGQLYIHSLPSGANVRRTYAFNINDLAVPGKVLVSTSSFQITNPCAPFDATNCDYTLLVDPVPTQYRDSFLHPAIGEVALARGGQLAYVTSFNWTDTIVTDRMNLNLWGAVLSPKSIALSIRDEAYCSQHGTWSDATQACDCTAGLYEGERCEKVIPAPVAPPTATKVPVAENLAPNSCSVLVASFSVTIVLASLLLLVS